MNPNNTPTITSNIKRDYSIDSIKGLCMLLVIIDHCGIWLHPAVDCLEVPTFFIASGFVFKADTKFSKLIRSKVRRLIIPYILYTIAYIIICKPTTPLLYNFILPANEPLWFIKTLVWIFLLAFTLTHVPFHRVFKSETEAQKYNKYIILIISFAGAFLASLHHSQLLTLCGLQQAILSLPLFCVGYILKNSKILKFPLSLIAIALWIITARYNIRLHDSYIGPNFLLFYISAIAGFCAIYSIFHLLKRIKALEYIGQKSLEVLGVHIIVIRLITPSLPQWYILIPITVASCLLYAFLLSLTKETIRRFFEKLKF
jgi:fucose 4-O-acetylase-like acetyltransferase